MFRRNGFSNFMQKIISSTNYDDDHTNRVTIRIAGTMNQQEQPVQAQVLERRDCGACLVKGRNMYYFCRETLRQRGLLGSSIRIEGG